ncbi:uncharacterized protein EV420DRAFT_725234 [Desarmillaria tabescens]|uniref:Uncharacterized protein n=1 Tax=Armillaria tabescens TaxID=1929756 RepID=A0AA39MZ23_ARMTA|nr:uncharacterized protein EV420DRAFT_725234 [Desarmillaria tabescens]KAK0451175.1 hypothetical protein EV420DRAFT_725234 [Desarmillaria tabescens]
MESLDLNTLAGSLPTAHQNAEAELLNNFKAAALSITTLYRSSRDASKRAYSAGYAAACQDLLAMIQRGVSVGGIAEPGTSESNGMSIGRVMDWIDARLDAVKSRQEEEVEEEEKEKERGRKSTTTAAPTKVKVEAKEQIPPMPTPNSPWPRTQRQSPQPSTPSPPPPPPSTLRQTQRSTNRAKPTSSSNSKGGGDSPNISPLPLLASDYPFNLVSEDTLSVPSFPVPDVVAGAKRRHAVMMMLDSSSAPVSTSSTTASSNCSHGSGSGGNRRRTRSTRNNASHLQNQNVNSIQLSSEAMDIEDDNGRERKRVARR